MPENQSGSANQQNNGISSAPALWSSFSNSNVLGNIAIASNGDVIRAYRNDSTLYNGDIVVQRLTGSGSLLWERRLTAGYRPQVGSVLLNPDGDIFLVGGNMLDENGESNLNDSDVFAARLSVNGNVIWSRSYSAGVHEIGAQARLLPGGNIILTGRVSDVNDSYQPIQRINNFYGAPYSGGWRGFQLVINSSNGSTSHAYTTGSYNSGGGLIAVDTARNLSFNGGYTFGSVNGVPMVGNGDPNGANTYLIARNETTRVTQWTRMENWIRSNVICDTAQNRIYYVNRGSLRCVEGSTGREIWSRTLGADTEYTVERFNDNGVIVAPHVNNGLPLQITHVNSAGSIEAVGNISYSGSVTIPYDGMVISGQNLYLNGVANGTLNGHTTQSNGQYFTLSFDLPTIFGRQREFFILPSATSLSEGQTLRTAVSTTGVAAGTTLYYSLSGTGINASDFSSGALTGSGTVAADGTLYFSHTLRNDLTTEGNESLAIRLFSDANRTQQVGSTATVTVVDTSRTPDPTYTVTPTATSINEGQTLTTAVSTTGVAAGTTLYYSLSGTGINASDFSSGALTGSGTVAADGTLYFSHTLRNDLTTEGNESLAIRLFSDANRTQQVGSTATVTVVDTSRTPRAFFGNTSTFATDNQIYSGHIDNVDEIHSYNAELSAGQSIEVINRAGESRYTFIRGIYNSSGTLQANTTFYYNHGNSYDRVNYVASTAGTYRVDVGSYASGVGSYNLDVTIGQRSSVDFSSQSSINSYFTGGSSTGQNLSFDSSGFASANGFIAPNEQDGANDVYSFQALAGRTYTVRMQGAPSGNGTLSDTYIRGIYFGSGTSTSLGSNDDSGGTLDSLYTFTASQSGTYRVHAGAFGSSTGSYRLSVQQSRTALSYGSAAGISNINSSYTSTSSFSSLATSLNSYSSYQSAFNHSSYSSSTAYSANTQVASQYSSALSSYNFSSSSTTSSQFSQIASSSAFSQNFSSVLQNSSFTSSSSSWTNVNYSTINYSSLSTRDYSERIQWNQLQAADYSEMFRSSTASRINYASAFSSSSFASVSTSNYSSINWNTAFSSSSFRNFNSYSNVNWGSAFSQSSFRSMSTSSYSNINWGSAFSQSSFRSMSSRSYSNINWGAAFSQSSFSSMSSSSYSNINWGSAFSQSSFRSMSTSSYSNINWGSAFSQSSFSSMSSSSYSNINWGSAFSQSSFSSMSSSSYSNINWGSAFSQSSFSSMSSSSYSNINWGSVEYNELTSARSYSNINWGSVQFDEITSASTYNSINWGRVDFNEITSTQSYSDINWGRVQYNEMDATDYRNVNWGNVDFSEMSASTYNTMNWSRVQFSEMGRCNLRHITDDLGTYGSGSSRVTTRHISSASSTAIDYTRGRDIVTGQSNLGDITITGENSRTTGDIYGLATGTNMQIRNFNVGVDYLNMGSLAGASLALSVESGNTIVRSGSNALATLYGVSVSSQDALFGAAA